MEYTNAQKLAAVLSYWARPAISQVASEGFGRLRVVQGIQNTLVSTGLVTDKYRLSNDLKPVMDPAIDNLLQPILEGYIKSIPDNAIPSFAHGVIDKYAGMESVSIMDGLVVFDKPDIEELKELLDKNLPLAESESYEVIL